jgi:hypothetical protein
MNIMQLGAIGELGGGVAVIATLVYLAIQIRSNTVTTQTASRQEVAREYRQIVNLHLDIETAIAFREGLWDYPNMAYEKTVLFATVVNNEALFFQGVFAQHESGQLEQETYESYLRWFSSIISTPGGSAWWEDTARPIFVVRMVVAVDKRIAIGDLPNIREIAQFRRNPDSP